MSDQQAVNLPTAAPRSGPTAQTSVPSFQDGRRGAPRGAPRAAADEAEATSGEMRDASRKPQAAAYSAEAGASAAKAGSREPKKPLDVFGDGRAVIRVFPRGRQGASQKRTLTVAWYNDIDPYCCEVLRERIREGRLPGGTVEGRDVRLVRPEEIPDGGQVHLFAGIGGFGLACRLAGVPDDFDLWTGGFPCQDISTAGRGAGLSGARSGLFFEVLRLLRGVRRRPAWLLLENVPALRTRGYDRVHLELERLGYAVAPVVVGAWTVGAPHKRDRVWIVCRRMDYSLDGGWEQTGRGRRESDSESTGHSNGTTPAESSPLADAARHGQPRQGPPERPDGQRIGERGHAVMAESGRERRQGPGRGDAGPLAATPPCAWPSRPGQPQHAWEAPRLVKFPVGGAADGLPVRLARFANRNALKACGNSIVPQVAAAVLRAMMFAETTTHDQ